MCVSVFFSTATKDRKVELAQILLGTPPIRDANSETPLSRQCRSRVDQIRRGIELWFRAEILADISDNRGEYR